MNDEITEEELENTRFEFSDDVMFGKVMENEDIAREFLEKMGPEKAVSLLHQPIRQLDLKADVRVRGIRPDIFVQTGSYLYDIEMQQKKNPEVLKRMLYADYCIRTQYTPQGVEYKDFPNTCVIFISLNDELGTGRPVHVFDGVSDQFNQRFRNGSMQILYNACRWREATITDHRAILEYTSTHRPVDEYTRRIQMFVDEKNQDRAFKLDAIMRRRREIDLLNEGKAIGINEGKVIGINEGKNIATADFTRALFKSGMSSEEISLRLNMPLDRVRSMIWAS